MSWIPVDRYKPKEGKLIIAYTNDGLQLVIKATKELKGVIAWQYAPAPYKAEITTNLYGKCGSCKYFDPTGFKTIYGLCGGVCSKRESLFSRTKVKCKLYELDPVVKFSDAYIKIGG